MISARERELGWDEDVRESVWVIGSEVASEEETCGVREGRSDASRLDKTRRERTLARVPLPGSSSSTSRIDPRDASSRREGGAAKERRSHEFYFRAGEKGEGKRGR